MAGAVVWGRVGCLCAARSCSPLLSDFAQLNCRPETPTQPGSFSKVKVSSPPEHTSEIEGRVLHKYYGLHSCSQQHRCSVPPLPCLLAAAS